MARTPYHYLGIVTPPLVNGAASQVRFALLEGKPCPQDVHGGVNVRVGLVAARKTPELRLGNAVAFRGVPALRAPLGGVTRVDSDHCPSGAFSLGGQDPQEDAPSRILDGFVQASFGRRTVRLVTAIPVWARLRPLSHVGDREVFVDDEVVATDEGKGGLVGVIQALAADLPVQRCHLHGRLLAALAAALLACENPLGCG